MSKLLEEPRILTHPQKFAFSIENSAWYMVSVAARVKSEKQRGNHETDDEELTIKLDDVTFPKPNTVNNLRNAPAAFSGGSQHNEEKSARIIIALSKGEHTLTLTPQHQAEVVSVSYEPLPLTENKIRLALNEQSKDFNEQPWITFALVSHRFNQVTIQAKIWWHFFNGDDLQVRVNDNIISHATNTKRHKNWVFHAQAVWDIFGREQVETRSLSKTSPEQKISYVELWADRTPLLQEIVFEGDDLEAEINSPASSSIQIHKYSLGTNGKDFNKYDVDIANIVDEINKEFLNQLDPPLSPLDPNLIKAMAYVESKVGVYESPAGNYPASPDIMQIADPRNPAIHTLNHDGWVDPNTGQEAKEYMWTPEGVVIMNYEGKAKVNSVRDSIYWAVIWLYHKAEILNQDGSRSWRVWQETVARYNGGGDTSYQEKVYEIYQKGDWK